MNKLYHNPRCSKSRQTKELLEENCAEFEVIEYLKDSPSEKEIAGLVKALGLNSAHDLMRTKETAYKENNVSALKGNEAGLIKAMAENPILIERPIFVVEEKAAIGRPPESVLELI